MECICNCEKCNQKTFKNWDVVKLTNQWGETNTGIIVNIINNLATVSTIEFKGDYSIFDINNPAESNVIKLKTDKQSIIEKFDPWWKEHYSIPLK